MYCIPCFKRNTHFYGTPDGTFLFQYLTETLNEKFMFKRDFYVGKKNDMSLKCGTPKYGTTEGTFPFRYLAEKKSKQ